MDIKRAICHEAGHVVAALHLGLRVERIEVHQGIPRSLIVMDRTREMKVVLASGVAAERLEFGDHDDKGSADDQKKISECGGGAIESYLDEACSIIRLNEPCFSRLRERLTLKWTENQAESEAGCNFNADSSSLTFELLSRQDIETIWSSQWPN